MSWPGLSVTEEDMKIDPDALEQAANDLQSELDTLISSAIGTPGNLRSQAALPSGAFGTWQTARDMESGYATSYGALLAYYDKLIEQLGAAIDMLRITAAEARGTDEGAQAAFNAEDPTLSGGGGGGGNATVVV